MDTENFLVERRVLVERLDVRRLKDPASYRGLGSVLGGKLPTLARWAVGMAPRRGLMTTLMEVGISLAVPLLMKKKVPFVSQLLSHFLPSKS